MMGEFKRAMAEKGCTGKKLAEITGRDAGTVSRYLNGETKDVPFDFVIVGARYLGISLNALAGIPEKETKDALYEHIRELYEAQLRNKDDHIAALKRRVEKLEDAHEKEIARLERAHEKEIGRIEADHAEKTKEHEETIADQRKRMDRKNIIILILFVVMVIVCCVALYWILDALNGDWGKIRYGIYALPTKWSAATESFLDFFRI